MHQPTDHQWREEAQCARTDPELWFPAPGQSPTAAKRICAGCPVRAQCLSDALAHRDVAFGVRGGLTPTQRRELLHHNNGRAA